MSEAGISFEDSKYLLPEFNEWQIVAWKSEEMYLVGQGIVELAKKAGGFDKLKQLLGGNVTLIRSDTFFIPFMHTPANTDPIFKGDFVLFHNDLFQKDANGRYNEDWIRGTAVHELAHIIAYNTTTPDGRRPDFVVPRTDKPVSKYAADNNLGLEFWADSVMVWVYPNAPRQDPQPLQMYPGSTGDWIDRFLTGKGWPQ